MEDYRTQDAPDIKVEAKLVYRKYPGKNGKSWYVPINIDNPADQILVHDPSEKGGFGGSTLHLQVLHGTEVFEEKVRGPWHSNSMSLFESTGLDIRDRHKTFVVMGTRRRSEEFVGYTIEDIVYMDTRPVIGHFDRAEALALSFANARKERIYFFKSSYGGSCHSFVDPGDDLKKV